jgi:uncharacterized membrane-anchored protein YjiN (DUF445 family)
MVTNSGRPTAAYKNADDPRPRELRRMRVIAMLLLALMTVLFIASSLAMDAWPKLAYLRAFAEAAMVGACADWFAVAALFRRPFGLPIPHTGIVPRNKEKIGAALGRFVSNNFLSPSVLAKKLAKLEAAQWAGAWLCDPINAHRIAREASLMLPEILGSLPGGQIADWLAALARSGIDSLPAAPLASKILSIARLQGESQGLIDRVIDVVETSLLGQQNFIREKVAQNSSRFVPGWVDRILAVRVIKGLRSTLAEMRAPEHPWRIGLQDALDTLIFDLAHDPDMYARGELIKAELLANPVFLAQVDELCGEVEAQIDGNLSSHVESVALSLQLAIQALGKWLRGNEKIQTRLNRQLRHIALRAVAPRRAEIGAYISEVVANWDSVTLVNRLELQVGSDLQYIRINGTLVGGLVGLILFVVSKWIKPI